MQPVVEGNGFGKKRGIGVGGFLLALVTAGALTHVAVRMKGIEVAYDLGRERRISTELEEQRRRLQIEIGMLKDPGRVVTLARDKLKMAPPAAGDIIRAAPGALPAAAAVTAAAAAAATNDKTAAAKNRSAAKPPAKTPPIPGAQAATPTVRAAAAAPARDESAESE